MTGRKAAAQVLAGAAGALEIEAQLRFSYARRDAEIGQQASERLARGEPSEQVARWAVKARNDAKSETRRVDIDALRLGAEERNVKLYGDPVGPTYDQLRAGQKALDDAQIVAGASRSNEDVNASARLNGWVLAPLMLLGAVALLRPQAWPREARWRWGAWLLAGAVGGWTGAKLASMLGASLGGRPLAWAGALVGLVLVPLALLAVPGLAPGQPRPPEPR